VIVRELELDLDAFEGPFDLLLPLVLKDELDLREQHHSHQTEKRWNLEAFHMNLPRLPTFNESGSCLVREESLLLKPARRALHACNVLLARQRLVSLQYAEPPGSCQ